MNTTKPSVAVIGAGIIGVNCAIALQESGYQVTVFDPKGVGNGCSKNNAGHFATEQVFPMAEYSLLWQLPKLIFHPNGPVSISPRHFFCALPWFMRFVLNTKTSIRAQNTTALKQLNELAIPCYQSLLKRANISSLMSKQGSLLVFESTPLITINKVHEQYCTQGVNVELLNQNQLHQLEPNLHVNIKYGLWFKDVAHSCNPYLLTLSLAQYAKSLGVNFSENEVKTIQQKQNEVEITTDVPIQFDKVLIATGAWSKKMVAQLGYKLPMEAERGYSVMLPQECLLKRPVASYERKFIMTPMSEGLRLAGLVEFSGLTSTPSVKKAINLLHQGQQIIRGLNKEAIEKIQLPKNQDAVWSGCRPSLPDSLPVIGQAPHHLNIYFAFGHQHLGLTQGAITGKLMAELMNQQALSVDLQPFSIARFQ